MPNMPITSPPQMHRDFSTGYNDFSFQSHPPEAHEQTIAESTSIDRDDELLSFQPPLYNFTLLDRSDRRTSVSLNARLHGMFFMADQPNTGIWPQTPPPELTCYRRNLFQVTGSITLPRNLQYILTDHGERVPIMAQELAVSATESVEGHAVKLISVPWKTPITNAPTTPEDKTEKEPVTIPLDNMSNQDMDADYATFPIAWKRLQFRIATANNGRRKELQQHFIVRLKLVATLPTGAKVPIAEAKSVAIVVRGRSPRNFQQRKDLAVGGEKISTRKGPNTPTIQRRATTGSPSHPPCLKREHSDENSFSPFNFVAENSHPQSGFRDWTKPSSGSSSAPAFPTPQFSTPTLPSSKSADSASPPSAPQPLILDNNADFKRPSQRPQKSPRKSTHGSSRPHPYKNTSLPSLPSTKALLSNPLQNGKPKLPEAMDSADFLYEYLPIPPNQWVLPADAIYRPQVVPSIAMAAGAAGRGRPAIGGRPQRCFSEDVA